MSQLHAQDLTALDDEILSAIFVLRRDIASARQSRHGERWTKLERFIEGLKRPPSPYKHPFRLSDTEYGDLSRNEAFADGSQGLEAELPDEGYLFRLCSLDGLAYAGLRVRGTPEDTFRWLSRERAERGDWLPLGEYASGGALVAELGFTWWTSLALSPTPEGVVVAAQRLGLVLSGRYRFLLRCPAAHLKRERLARVPTVIDAFANDIFHPTDDTQQPKHGVTISLQSLNSLGEGDTEFVVGGIDVGLIEMYPIQVTDDMRRACPLWPDRLKRWELLRDYYQRMSLSTGGGVK